MKKDFQLSHRHIQTGLFILMAALVAAIYAHTLSVPFILDDVDTISANAHIRIETLTVQSLLHAAFESPLPRRPVANVSFALNYYWGGYHPFGYHVANILIHLMTGFWLFCFIQNTLTLNRYRTHTAIWLAFAATTIWLVHPLQTQSVTYTVQRMNSLAAMFYLMSLVFYVKGRLATRQADATPNAKRVGYFWYIGSIFAGIMAIGTKEIAATLPFFILLYEWYFFQDLSWNWIRKHSGMIFGMLMLIGSIVLLYLGTDPLDRISVSYSRRDFTIEQRLMTQLRVVVFYFSLLIWPHPSRLNLEHDFDLSRSLLDPMSTLLALAMLSGLLVTAVVLARRHRLFSFCILWIMGNLVIESSVIGLELVFEHRMYLPSMLAILMVPVWLQQHVQQRWAAAVLCAIAVVFSIWTYQRNTVWQDKVTLLTDCINKSPGKARPYNTLGTVYYHSGDYKSARALFTKVLELNPRHAGAHNNIGVVLALEKEYESAIDHFKEALRLLPGYADATRNLQKAIEDRQVDHDLRNFQALAQNRPDDPDIQHQLGKLYQQKGDLNSAIHHFNTAVSLRPDDYKSLEGLGVSHAHKGDYRQALHVFKKMIDLKPDLPSPYFYIASIKAKQNNKGDSQKWLKMAIDRGFRLEDMPQGRTRLAHSLDSRSR